MKIDGKLSLRHSHYKSLEWIDPSWVAMKHPNPTRDNGLLIVVRGEHCGKYVRRIHHKNSNGQVLMILAVVKRVQGAADTLLEEKLELACEALCIAFETKKEKELNSSLMTVLRKEARVR